MTRVDFDVVEAALDRDPRSFLEDCKEAFCRHPAHLVVGVDIDRLMGHIPADWIHKFHEAIEDEGRKPQRPLLVSTIFALSWKKLPLEQIGQIFEVGANYRQKNKKFYTHEPGNVAASLREDLIFNGLIPGGKMARFPEPAAPPPKPIDDESFKQRMKIYANPPLSLPEETMRKLFQEERIQTLGIPKASL